MNTLALLYEDDDLAAVHKPCGWMVHNSTLSNNAPLVLPCLRDQLGMRVYPVHRLDRPTSGIVLFTKNEATLRKMSAKFQNLEVEKSYLAIVRGWPPPEGEIDSPLRKGHQEQPARTQFRRLNTAELPFLTGRHPTSRYALVQVTPKTGRFHQIRRHFAHVRHPIIGDTTHGDGKQNRAFREFLQVDRLLLLANRLAFDHPVSGQRIEIRTEPDPEFALALQKCGWGELGEMGQDTGSDREVRYRTTGSK